MRHDWAVSIHDVAPATQGECERLLELLAPYATPITLLVTPHYRRGTRLDAARACTEWLRGRVARGDEVALHGYYHVDDGPPPRSPRDWAMRRLWTDREGEFAALDAHTARTRLDAGCALLRDAGLPPAGFVPPAWLLGRGARTALPGSGLAYTSTRDALLRLPDFTPLRAPSLVYSTRAGWRRRLSRHWNERRLALLVREPRLRLALHPVDTRHPQVLTEWRRLLDVVAHSRRATLETGWLSPTASATASSA